jgi:endonuclease-3
VGKQPFDPDVGLPRIRDAIRPFPKAMLFQLAEDGHTSVFEQLVACIISIRTRDETSLVIARRLFSRARTPAAVAALPVQEIAKLIYGCTFYEAKAPQVRAIAAQAVEQYGGELPCDFAVLTRFSGVGPKCANLVLGIACDQPRIGVDIHVHRITNRWGYVSEPIPEQTMRALESKLPRKYWVEINRLLVPFGKHICTGTLPKCSTCPVLEMCQQRNVSSHR